ncbi:hypothetical protein FQA47_010592 [Oryzias melastigma]|uniref:Uncharacterized protein n=1 Tax=Oryzias melastigma TaxID=30732 RepID=A0A834FI96_ORYME|nr:hypothetical protein FQA47_010592 [Oryzias melastigma]
MEKSRGRVKRRADELRLRTRPDQNRSCRRPAPRSCCCSSYSLPFSYMAALLRRGLLLALPRALWQGSSSIYPAGLSAVLLGLQMGAGFS